jgi:eukaryotic-like serine/threonine-protein kinase
MSSIDDLLHTGAALKGALGREALDLAADLRLLAPGDRVGPFRIVGELGRGGMGVVYEAERVDGAFEQRVAIKWLLARGGDTHVAQFRRERQILAALRHPHIARLLDGGETDDGMLWFAMERIEGRPIDRYCAERGARRRERLDLFEQVCEAVAFAHARLLVHRDIKPSNILVDSDGSAKLVDFGIAHVLDDGSAAVDAFTPGFASPEQAAGAPSSIAADVYSLGVLLRSLLHPKSAKQDIAGAAIVDNVELPESAELDAVAARAAATDPQIRYATVEALLDDLRRFRSHRPVEAYRGGHLYRLRRFLRRHWAAATVAVAALALIAMLSAAFIARISEERDQAELEAEKANAVTNFVVDLLRSADPAVHRGDKLTVMEVIAKGEGKADAELADQPDVHARLISALADVQLGLTNYSEALRLNERAVRIMKGLPDPPHKLIAQRLRTAAQSAWRLDQFERALALIDEAQTYNLGEHRDAYTAVSLMRTRGNILSALGRSDEGRHAAYAAVQIARDELSPGMTILGRALVGAGLQDELRADYARALEKVREATAIFIAAESHGIAHPDTFTARGNTALYLLELNQAGAAQKEVEDNLRHMLPVTGEDNAAYIRQASLAARIALANDDVQRAMRWIAPARRGWVRIEKLGHQAWLDFALAEGELALHASRPADALAWFERLDSAADGKDRDAQLGVIQAHCILGTQQSIADRIEKALYRDTLWSPRQAVLRDRLRLLCKGGAV